MFLSILKNSLLFFMCFHTYKEIGSHIPKTFSNVFYFFLSSFLLGLVTYYCKYICPALSYIIPFLCFSICILLLERTPSVRILFTSMLSYGFNSLLCGVLSLIIAIPFSFAPSSQKSLSMLLATITVFFVQYILIRLTLVHKKRQIISLVITLPQANTLAVFIYIILIIYTIHQILVFESPFPLILFCVIFLTAPILFSLWWRSQITRSYREKLRLLEVESLRTSQQEQANYISQLEKENERMGRIIHKDNRIVNAMADSVTEYLTDTTLSDTERYSKGVALAEHIESIRTDRQNILLSEEHIHPNPISQTGYVGVDALIAYMAKEAAQHHITLHFDFHTEFFENDSLCMSEEDLVHLLSDTLKNAIIATRHNNGKDIKLSMLKLKGIPTIAIFDSGIPFTIDTYMNFGLEKSSTHIDEGGSGIGLLDIWSLKEKYKITLYIDEYPTTDTFTKQMVFIFDKKNRYMISSNRYKEIQHQQSRADLYVVNPAVERSL